MGSPRTLYRCPRMPGPTGTEMGPPVLRTAVPRVTPSVGCITMARTTRSPMCWATSAVSSWLPFSVLRSNFSAKLISGSEPVGNSTSMTGPTTVRMRPSASAWPSTCDDEPCGEVARSVMGSTPWGQTPGGFVHLWRRCGVSSRGAGQGLGPADDLGDLGGDGGLPRAVGFARQIFVDVTGVVRGGLHRALPAGVLAGGGLEQAGEDDLLDVLGDELLQDGARIRLEHELRRERLAALQGGQAFPPQFMFEPDPGTILEQLIPKYVEQIIFAGLLESAASEHASRQRAMKAATDNAGDIIEDLTREANRARQIFDDVTGVVRGGLHRARPAGVLAGGGLEQAGEDDLLDVLGDELLQDGARIRLEHELRRERLAAMQGGGVHG